MFAFLLWPALTTLSDRFREAGWQAWAALVTLVLIPIVLFPALVYWWAIEYERAEAAFRSKRAALILGALHRRNEVVQPS
jgi:hypothetical protein